MMKSLDEIVALSHEFGTRDYVKGGGGNTSCKSSTVLWVKPSGTTLAGMTPPAFVAMDRTAMQRLYSLEIPSDPQAREAWVRDAMAAAVAPGSSGRPSVEAPLHELLPGAFVVHTHPALVNGMTCSKRGAEACARLFPEALWIPYTDPGYTLCIDVRRRVLDFAAKHGHAPALLFLENHGVFVTGDTGDQIRAIYGHVMATLRAEYASSGVATTLRVSDPVSAERIDVDRKAITAAMGTDAAVIVHSGAFPVPQGPVSPDHIVYSKSFPYTGTLRAGDIQSYQKERGAMPRVIVTSAGVFGVASTPKQADLALELAQDGALVCQLAAAFGGIQYMTDRARLFIENWEVESYRQKQV